MSSEFISIRPIAPVDLIVYAVPTLIVVIIAYKGNTTEVRLRLALAYLSVVTFYTWLRGVGTDGSDWLRLAIFHQLAILRDCLPVLVVAAIVFWRTKSTQVRICLVLALFWTWIMIYIGYRDTEAGFVYTPLGVIVDLPLFISIFFSEFVILKIVPAIRGSLLELHTLAALTYTISYFIISGPLYAYRLFRNALKQPEGDSGDPW